MADRQPSHDITIYALHGLRLTRSLMGLGDRGLNVLVAKLLNGRAEIRRLLLVILGLAALGASQSENHRFGQHWGLPEGALTALLLAFALALFGAAVAPPLDLRLFKRAPRTILGAAVVCTLVLAGHSSGQIQRVTDRLVHRAPFSNDAVTMSSCATDILINGQTPARMRGVLATLHNHNPYEGANIIRCLWQHGYYLNGDLTTPLQQRDFSGVYNYPSKRSLDRELRYVGLHNITHPKEFEWQISYPSGSFLVPGLAWLLGITDLRLLFVLCFLGAYAIVLIGAPRRLWPWIVLITYINMVVWTNAASGASDALYLLFVLIGWKSRHHTLLSSVAMGLAATIRQQAWFFLLPYAILIARQHGPRELWLRGRVVGGIFLLTNLPFFLLSPGAWASGILSPIVDPMFALGSGIIAPILGAADWSNKLVPLPPRPFFGALEFVALVLCLVTYARVCRRWPHLGLILAVVPLFLAWRSLFSYFYPVSILALAAVVELSTGETAPKQVSGTTRGTRIRPMAVRVARSEHLDLSA